MEKTLPWTRLHVLSWKNVEVSFLKTHEEGDDLGSPPGDHHYYHDYFSSCLEPD